VMFGIIELLIMWAHLETTKVGALGILRTVRALRIVRIIRVIKHMPFFRELRIMVHAMMASLKTLTWAVLVLASIFYISGIVFVRAVYDFCEKEHLWADESTAELRAHFGSLSLGMMTLYKSISGGTDWGDVLAVLEPLRFEFQAIYVTVVSFCILCAMNIVTGVFVESAMAASSGDREALVSDQKHDIESSLRQIGDLFEEMDQNNSGRLNFEEFEGKILSERALAYFSALNLDISEVKTLFQLLDIDGSGSIDTEEFVLGVKKLSGQSRALDIAVLQLELKWVMGSLTGFADFVEQRFDAMEKMIQRVEDSTQPRLRSKTHGRAKSTPLHHEDCMPGC